MKPILSARNVEKSFGAFVAARDISCDIQPRETVSIIGANGAGKTTFVNMISGHLVPSKGTIMFNGCDITGLASRKITQMGLVRSFQIAQVFPTLTVIENMCSAMAIARCNGNLVELCKQRMLAPDIVQAAEEKLAQFAIAKYRDFPANALSQGVKKILDVAMAAAGEPQLILLDEPTSGVSLEERYGLMKYIIDALKQRGVTIIFIEHDMEIVAHFADRVLAFIDGTIIADGSPKEVFARPDVIERITGGTSPGKVVQHSHA